MNRAVYLDRDGTINVDKDYLYRIDDFEYLPGAIEGLRALQDMGYLLIVVTNQSGIARGYYSVEDYERIDKWMKDDLASKGIKITASYYCPHLQGAVIPEYDVECECRKPKLELFYRASKEWDIDIDNSIAIGDKPRDVAICDATECKGFLFAPNGIKTNESVRCVSNWNELIGLIRN